MRWLHHPLEWPTSSSARYSSPTSAVRRTRCPARTVLNSSPVRPEAERSPSISPAKSENRSPRSEKDCNLKSSGPKREIQEEFTERRAFQVVKRKRNKSEEERNSDICKLSIRDELEQGVDLGSSRTGRQRDFPAGLPHGFPPGIPPMVPARGAARWASRYRCWRRRRERPRGWSPHPPVSTSPSLPATHQQ